MATPEALLTYVRRPLVRAFPRWNWEGLIWKIIIAEVIYFLLKIGYGLYATAELIKKRPDMVIPEYMNILPWQAFASPVFLIVQGAYPALTGESLDEARGKALEDCGIPIWVDDIFGKYTYIIMMLIPIVIILWEWNKRRKGQKEYDKAMRNSRNRVNRLLRNMRVKTR